MRCEWVRKPPKLPPSLSDFVTLPEEDRATVIGSMHKNLVKIPRAVTIRYDTVD